MKNLYENSQVRYWVVIVYKETFKTRIRHLGEVTCKTYVKPLSQQTLNGDTWNYVVEGDCKDMKAYFFQLNRSFFSNIFYLLLDFSLVAAECMEVHGRELSL